MWPATLHWLDDTRPDLAANLAFDDSLLDAVNDDPSAVTLRCWESPNYGVVVGRSNVIEREVDIAACRADDVPVVRRSSGGGAVVVGPGCLCFTLALPVPLDYSTLGISGVTKALMQRLADGLSSPSETVCVRGISDLAVRESKICGNAQRWRRQAFLHHGTILYGFDLLRISRYLQFPSREPDYRHGRNHREFVTNFQRSRNELIDCLTRTWNAKG